MCFCSTIRPLFVSIARIFCLGTGKYPPGSGNRCRRLYHQTIQHQNIDCPDQKSHRYTQPIAIEYQPGNDPTAS